MRMHCISSKMVILENGTEIRREVGLEEELPSNKRLKPAFEKLANHVDELLIERLTKAIEAEVIAKPRQAPAPAPEPKGKSLFEM